MDKLIPVAVYIHILMCNQQFEEWMSIEVITLECGLGNDSVKRFLQVSNF